MERRGCWVAEEQSTSADIDEHEVIDARDLLVHLKRNSPATQSRDSEAVLGDDKKEEVKGKVMTTARKWELHEEALQQWRRDTATHKQRYQLVQQKYEAYLLEKKGERAEGSRGRCGEYVQPGGRGPSPTGGPATAVPPPRAPGVELK